MIKIVYGLAAYFLLTGVYVIVAPIHFYTNIPGVSLMGSFNMHFIRDVGLVFLASGGAMFWGVKKGIKSTAVAGASWPFLHAVFHIQIWVVMRDCTIDLVTLADFTAVIIPGFLALYATVKIKGRKND